MSKNKNIDGNGCGHSILLNYKKIAATAPVLKKQEEYDMIQLYKNNPDSQEAAAAREKIINSYLRTAISLAEKFSFRNHLDIVDLVQCGIVGIITGLEKFDLNEYKKITTNTGSLFSFFVYRAILTEMNTHYRENIRQFSVTATTNDRLIKINKMYKIGKFNDLNNDYEKIAERAAAELGVKIEEVKFLIDLFKPSLSLNQDGSAVHSNFTNYDPYIQAYKKTKATDAEWEKENWHDFVLPEQLLENPAAKFSVSDYYDHLLNNIDKLDQQERFIIMNRFGINCEKKKINQIARLINENPAKLGVKIKKIQEKLKSMILDDNFQKVHI